MGILVILGFLILWIIYMAAVRTTVEGRPFRFGLVGQAKTVDPALVENHVEKILASTMYESLVWWDDQTQSLKPCLASNWGYSKVQKHYIYDKADVTFHNGRRMQALDVKRSGKDRSKPW